MTTIRRQLAAYDLAHPRRVQHVCGGSECKLLIWAHESERHPDIAVYLTPPPEDDASLWSVWVPELVIEVVSPGSETRDYNEKREEYCAFGVREYWIIDAAKQEVLALQGNGGKWRETIVRAPQEVASLLLPGFKLNVQAVFDAAAAVH